MVKYDPATQGWPRIVPFDWWKLPPAATTIGGFGRRGGPMSRGLFVLPKHPEAALPSVTEGGILHAIILALLWVGAC
jgi:hypothetical protein